MKNWLLFLSIPLVLLGCSSKEDKEDKEKKQKEKQDRLYPQDEPT